MRCPECPSPYSDVLETRKHKDGLKRRRICGNGHKFSTVEKYLGSGAEPASPEAAYRAVVLGNLTAAEYARRAGRNRSTVGRWLAKMKELHAKKLG